MLRRRPVTSKRLRCVESGLPPSLIRIEEAVARLRMRSMRDLKREVLRLRRERDCMMERCAKLSESYEEEELPAAPLEPMEDISAWRKEESWPSPIALSHTEQPACDSSATIQEEDWIDSVLV